MRGSSAVPRQVEIQYSRDGSTWVTQKIKQTGVDGRAGDPHDCSRPTATRWRVKVPATVEKRVRTPVKTFAVQAKETESVTPRSHPSPRLRSRGTRRGPGCTSSTPTAGADDHRVALEQLWILSRPEPPGRRTRRPGPPESPQALPGDKMASAGADWKTNPQTQIKWGASYIKGRYTDHRARGRTR